MRALLISGVILVAVGLWIIFRPPNYTREESVLKVGSLEAKVQQEHRVPGWIGGMAVGAGAVLLGAAIAKR